MKCARCGFESAEDFNFCPVCSEPQTPVEPVSINPAADVVMPALKDNLFLAICILITIYCGLALVSGTLPLIQILATIFLWLVYAQSKKGFVSENRLRNVSGTIYAGYVINNVVFGIIAFCGIFIGGIFNLVANTAEFTEIMAETLTEYEINLGDIDLTDELMSLGGWVIGFVFLFIAAIGLLINILGYRKIHRFAKSIYQSVMYGAVNFENARGAKNWLIVFGVFTAISAVGSISSGIVAVSSGCLAAAQIIASVLIVKYLIPTQNYI